MVLKKELSALSSANSVYLIYHHKFRWPKSSAREWESATSQHREDVPIRPARTGISEPSDSSGTVYIPSTKI